MAADDLRRGVALHAGLWGTEQQFIARFPDDDYAHATEDELRASLARRAEMETLAAGVVKQWPVIRCAMMKETCTVHMDVHTATQVAHEGTDMIAMSAATFRTPPVRDVSFDATGTIPGCVLCKTNAAETSIFPGGDCPFGGTNVCECVVGEPYGVCLICWTNYAKDTLDKNAAEDAYESPGCAKCTAPCPVCRQTDVCIFRIVKNHPAPAPAPHPSRNRRRMTQSQHVVPPPPKPLLPPTAVISASDTSIPVDFDIFDIDSLMRSDDTDGRPGGTTSADSFVDADTGEVMTIVRPDSLTHLVARTDLPEKAGAVLGTFVQLDKMLAQMALTNEEQSRAASRTMAEALRLLQQPVRTASGRRAPTCKNCRATGHYEKTCPVK